MKRSASEGFGERLAKYRRLAGMSAQQLSDKLGGEMSRGVIANIESGRKTDITIDQAIALAWALEIPFASLVVPLDRPLEYVALIRGTGPKSWLSIRASDLLWWVTSKPDPFRVERSYRSPAGVIAREIMRVLEELSVLTNQMYSARKKADEDPEFEYLYDERRSEFHQKRQQLIDLGLDMSDERDVIPPEEWEQSVELTRRMLSKYDDFGLNQIPVSRLQQEQWTKVERNTDDFDAELARFFADESAPPLGSLDDLPPGIGKQKQA